MWSTTDHLLAAVVDELALSRWLYVVAHLDEHTPRPPQPQPVPRPGLPDPGPAPDPASVYDTSHIPAIDPSELATWLAT